MPVPLRSVKNSKGSDFMRILNFGSMNLDYVYQVEHFVQPGETLLAHAQAVNPGGKGLNQSIALARAGAKTCHAGCVGVGGEMLIALLQENGVDVSCIEAVQELQGNAVIQVDRTGENCILLFGGSNQCVRPEQIEKTLARFDKGDYLLLQNEINNLPMIVSCAGKRKMKIVLNPSPFNEQLEQVDFSKLEWLIVNEVEMEQLSGFSSPEKSWEKLHRQYPDLSLLVTLGEEGSIAFTKRETVRQEAVKVKAVDTTAAGDTYTGYFLAGIMEGMSLQQSMERANVAAAAAVTRAGAAESIPRKEQLPVP